MEREITPTIRDSAVHAEGRRGRAAISNPTGRFERQSRVQRDTNWKFDCVWGGANEVPPPLETSVNEEACRTIIARNDSPDVPFSASINPYRGCEHGCIYCYARPTHSYYGLSAGLDFESRLFVKPNAARVLRKELSRPGYKCEVIALGTNTDCYQPLERERRVTRGILELLASCDHPVSIVTKSHLVTRDIDLLGPMAKKGLAQVFVSITTLNRGLARRMEPRASTPGKRLDTIREISSAGIPVGVLTSPVIPGLTDSELERILQVARDAGATSASYLLVRLPHDVKDLFREWLNETVPDRASRVMSLIHDTRNGEDNDPRFGSRMKGSGPFAEIISQRFKLALGRLGLNESTVSLETNLFHPPDENSAQLTLNL
tara:strand:+ start:753 stop:1880 length:1128 start_codon:yes stop_codon:yes gene_type:complete